MATTGGSTVFDDAPVPRRAGRLDALLTRLGLTSVLARDGLLAAAVLLVTLGLLLVLFQFVLEAEALVVSSAQAVVITVAACAQALPLVLRRVRPLLCLGLVVACQVVVVAASPPDLSVGGVPVVIAAYTVGTLLPARRALLMTGVAVPVGALVAGLVALVSGAGLLLPVLTHLAAGIVLYLVSALVGGAVATRRNYVELLRLRASELVRTQQATTRAAIFAERSRMARELHDVAAHHLSGLVVQAAAVERQIDSDPEAAKRGTAWIRGQGKATLDSLRLIVGVLRERPGSGGSDDDGHDAPPPGLGALDGLVRTARGLGDTVDVVREGRPRDLAPIADAAFYRVAQESLSNARQHAPGAPVRMTVRFGEREVSLEVVNERAGGTAAGSLRGSGLGVAGGSALGSTFGSARDFAGDAAQAPERQGLGLIGMGERAQLVGATLTTGATPSGGWRVLLTLPLHREHDEPQEAASTVSTAGAPGVPGAPAEGGPE